CRRTAGFLGVCLLPFGLLAGGLHFFGPRSAPPGVTLTDLQGVADLQARFTADRGLPRLIVIFSPPWGECRPGARLVQSRIPPPAPRPACGSTPSGPASCSATPAAAGTPPG